MAGQDRWQTLTFTTGTLGTGAHNINQAISLWRLNIARIEITPNGAGSGPSFYKLFKRDTFLADDRIFTSGAIRGDYVYPTHRAGLEVSEGQPIPYQDDDLTAFAPELHLQITNNDVSQTYTVSIRYEETLLSKDGKLGLGNAGSIDNDYVSPANIDRVAVALYHYHFHNDRHCIGYSVTSIWAPTSNPTNTKHYAGIDVLGCVALAGGYAIGEMVGVSTEMTGAVSYTGSPNEITGYKAFNPSPQGAAWPIVHGVKIYNQGRTAREAGTPALTSATTYAIKILNQEGSNKPYAVWSEGGRSFHLGNLRVGNATPTAPTDIMNALDLVGSLGLAGDYINTSTYTAADKTILLLDASSTAITIALPAVAGAIDRVYICRRLAGANTLTLDPSGAETIDGVASIAITNWAIIWTPGGGWFTLASG